MGFFSILLLLLAFLSMQLDAYLVAPQRQKRLILQTDSKAPVIPDKAPLPTVLQQIVDERQEFQIHLGRAMDTLRKDMQNILTETPDFSIYHEELEVLDPSGVQLSGLEKYKSAVAFFQTFCRFWFSPKSVVQHRMVYDFCRSSIRIAWHAMLIPKVPWGRPIHVDGISLYTLDPTSGLISQHKIEKLVINQSPAQPPYGILSLLQQDALKLASPAPPLVGAIVQRQTKSCDSESVMQPM